MIEKKLAREWKKACLHLKKRLSASDYEVWVSPLRAEPEADRIVIVAPDKYFAAKVKDSFSGAISDAFSLTALAGFEIGYRFDQAAPEPQNVVGRLPSFSSQPIPAKNLAIGFMIKGLIQAGLPHKAVKGTEYSHTNGRWTLTVQGRKKYGVPYGAIPRLILVWLITEIHQTKSTRISLGNSFTSFMKKVGLVKDGQRASGGQKGSIPRIKKQIFSLLSSSFHLEDNERPKGFEGDKSVSLLLSKERQLWWDNKNPDQGTFFDSYIEVSQEFYDLVMSERIPIDIDALKEIKSSSISIDILFWLTLKMFACKETVFIPWESLRQQFSPESDSNHLGNFRNTFLAALKRVKGVYTQLDYKASSKGLSLKPGRPLLAAKKVVEKL